MVLSGSRADGSALEWGSGCFAIFGQALEMSAVFVFNELEDAVVIARPQHWLD
jgi:SpoU rRNA methylase family enzyme